MLFRHPPCSASGPSERSTPRSRLGRRSAPARGTSSSTVSKGVGATLIEHWDGTRWSIIPSPNPPPSAGHATSAGLTSVGASSTSDVWAVGSWNVGCPSGGCSGGVVHTLTERWDGTSWAIVPSPDTPGIVRTVDYLVSVYRLPVRRTRGRRASSRDRRSGERATDSSWSDGMGPHGPWCREPTGAARRDCRMSLWCRPTTFGLSVRRARASRGP